MFGEGEELVLVGARAMKREDQRRAFSRRRLLAIFVRVDSHLTAPFSRRSAGGPSPVARANERAAAAISAPARDGLDPRPDRSRVRWSRPRKELRPGCGSISPR